MSFSPDTTLPCTVLEAANYTDQIVPKCYGVIHSIESPLGKSWAEALGGPAYFQNPATKASVCYLTDADSIVQSVPENRWTWSTGSPGSRRGKHIEQAGYAAFTRAQWLGLPEAVGSTYVRPNGAVVTYTAQDALHAASQFKLLARLVADISKRSGWTPRRGTRDELIDAINNDRQVGVWFEHADITAWVGGTTHTDPGSSYPFDELMAAARQVMAGGPAIPSTPTTPTAPTNPQEDDEMSQAQVNEIKQAIADAKASNDTQLARIRQVLRQLPTTTVMTLRPVSDEIDERTANAVVAKLRANGVIPASKG